MWVAVGVVAFILLAVVVLYNGLITKKNMVENAFASIDAQLKKRYDLIPNLVSTVKGYTKHEAAVLRELTEMRAKALSGALSSDEAVGLNNRIGQAVNGIMVAAENYPQLKASDNFMHLQRTLNEIEEQVSAARRFFNSAVTDYNTAIATFPGNVLAGSMGFGPRQLFAIPAEQRDRPDVKDLLEA